MLSPGPGESRLDVGAALRDGWAAFRRAPVPLTGYMVLVSALALGLSLVEAALTPTPGLPSPFPLAVLLCRLASWVLVLWSMVGLVRGAWIALEGRQPRFGDLLRWDGQAMGRVFLASLLLGVILWLVALPLSLLITAGLDQMLDITPTPGGPAATVFNPSPGALLQFTLGLLVLLGVLVYAQVNQHFLVQLASLKGNGPLATLREGRAVVDRQWWSVLGLLVVEFLLLLAGALALLVGLFVAVPVIVCMSTAAYRQLFVQA